MLQRTPLHVHKDEYEQFNYDWAWPPKIKLSNFGDGILEQAGTEYCLPSAKHQLGAII